MSSTDIFDEETGAQTPPEPNADGGGSGAEPPGRGAGGDPPGGGTPTSDRERLIRLESDVAYLKVDGQRLRTDIATMSGKVDELAIGLNTVNNAIESLKNAVNDIHLDMREMRADMARRFDGFEKRQDDFEKRQDRFEKKQDGFEKRQNGFETQLGIQNVKLDSMEKSIASHFGYAKIFLAVLTLGVTVFGIIISFSVMRINNGNQMITEMLMQERELFLRNILPEPPDAGVSPPPPLDSGVSPPAPLDSDAGSRAPQDTNPPHISQPEHNLSPSAPAGG